MSPKRKYDKFREGLGSLLKTGKFSDFIITCGDKTWNVHKAIVCTQLDFFGGASRFGKEAAEGKIKLQDDDPEIVGYMLEYMYEGDYRVISKFKEYPYWVRVERNKKMAKAEQESNQGLYGHDLWMWRVSRRYFSEIENGLPDGWNDVSLKSSCPGENHVYHHDPENLKEKDMLTNVFRQLRASELKKLPNSGLNELMGHAKVYVSADKYLVKDLKEVARQKFQDTIRHYYTFACNKFYKCIKEILQIVPDNDNNIREMIVERVRHEKAIYGTEKHPALKVALRDIPNLAYWVMCKEEEPVPSIKKLFDIRATNRWTKMIRDD